MREATPYLNEMAQEMFNDSSGYYWFKGSYPHTQDTKKILEHNWSIVKKRQQDASSRILAMLERTSNEVKSLQNGVSELNSIVPSTLRSLTRKSSSMCNLSLKRSDLILRLKRAEF